MSKGGLEKAAYWNKRFSRFSLALTDFAERYMV